MMKRYAVLGIIIALVVSIAAIGCSSSKPKSTPTKTPAQTATPTATATPTTEPTEEPGEAGQLPENYKFFMTWNDSDDNSGEMQFWVKGEMWRTDWGATQEETETQMVLLYDGQFGYLYMPATNQVMKYTTSWEMANPGAAFAQDFEDSYWGEVSDATILAGFEAACAGGASFDGDEDVNGISCMKFTCNFEGGGVSQYWIADSGWLVKVVTTLDDITTTMQYSEIEFNADISDSIFDINTVAPGVPIIDI